MPKISFIIPCYNEEETIDILFKSVENIMKKQLKEVEYNYVFVDDGSRDKTLEKIKKLVKKHKNIQYISFSRNFGKEAAMLAGLKYADGEYVSILDADMQHPPVLIPEMYKLLNSGDYDCICTRRASREGEPKLRSFFAKIFYVILNKLSMIEIKDRSQDFLMMTRPVVEAILSVGEYVRFFKGLFVWVGFRQKWIEYKNVDRVAGQTKWNFISLTKYALTAITSFSVQPMIWPFFFGVFLGLAGLITLIFADFLIGLILCLFAIQMGFMGICGYYMATIFLEVKNRPRFLIKETNVKK